MTRGIVIGVKQIIQKIDDELENYCMEISQKGIYWIQNVAQTFTNRIAELIEIIKQNQPLNMLEERKKMEENIFIAKLTANNDKMDQAIAKKVAHDLKIFFYVEAFNFAKDEFKQIMEKQQINFQKVHFIMEIEQECEKISNEQENNPNYQLSQNDKKIIDKLVHFYKDPKKFLDEQFQYKFDKLLNEYIIQCQKSFKDQYLKKINKVIKYFEEFLRNLRIKKADSNASILFQWHESSQKPKVEDINYKKFQKLALTQYFKKVLKKEWHFDKVIEFQNKELCFIRNPDINLPHQTDLNTDIGQSTIEKINLSILETDEISQLHKFFEQIIVCLNEYSVFEEEEKSYEGGEIESQIIEDDQIHENPQEIFENKINGLKMISKQDLIDEYQQDFKQFFMGCMQYCPLCRRQCDLVHNQTDILSSLKHECSQGHQMQGFGGSKSMDDNLAVLSTCNELRDNDVIVYKGDEIKWVKFKIEKFPNWSFETSSLNIKENRQKNVKIWNVVGQQLCKLYYDDDGIVIKFKKAENKIQVKAPNVHYILMLDGSSSMSCWNEQPWNDLMKAFNGFMVSLSSNINLKTSSKVSVILYDEESEICFQEQEPNVNLSSQIIPKWQGTDFIPPLKDARKLCLQNANKYDKFVLYFMSDGENENKQQSPEDVINSIVNDKSIIDKIEFYSVGFGKEAGIISLRQMAKLFPRGQYNAAVKPEELEETFQKLIPNIYE